MTGIQLINRLARMDNREAEVEVIIDDKLSLCAIESVKFENNKILLTLKNTGDTKNE